MTSYHVIWNEETKQDMVRNLKKWCSGHQPIWTVVGVAALAGKDMNVEIEVVAVDQEGE